MTAGGGAHEYPGGELDLFATAENWKSYFARLLTPYISGDVLEVGAGIGGTTRVLQRARHSSWTCLEPDMALASRLSGWATEQAASERPRLAVGTARAFAEESFDTVLYIDVMEHIEDDLGETRRAARLLRPGGRLVVLSPAHQWLYSPFDESIGHFRRYGARHLSRVVSASLRVEKLFFADSAGLLASAANRFLLREALPTRRQISFWDGVLVPLSRALDPLTGRRLGKSLICVGSKRDL